MGTGFYLFQPVIIVMAGEAATDGLCLVLSVWFLFFAERFLTTGRLAWWIAAAVMGALAAVSKLPFFMAAGLASVAILLVNRIYDVKRWLLLSVLGVVAAGALAAWSHHSDNWQASRSTLTTTCGSRRTPTW